MRPILIASLLLLLSAPLLADEGWTLQTADFRDETVTLVKFDEGGARVIPAGMSGQTLIPMESVLKLERAGAHLAAPAVKGKYNLFLLGGDHIAGELAGMQDEMLTWRSASLGDVKIPVRQLRAISRLETPPGMNEDRKEDQVLLVNRDTVRGIVTTITVGDDKKVNVQAGGDVVPVPLSAVQTIYFASAGRPFNPEARAFRVRFMDDSSLTAPGAIATGETLTLRLADGSRRELPLIAVRSIEQINGPLSWLSTHVPMINEQVWFSEATFPAQMDGPMAAGGQTFTRGISVHADSKLVYALDGGYKVFRTRFAVDALRNARSGTIANVTVRVLLDDRPVFEEKGVRAGKVWPMMSFDLGDAKTLTLEVTHNDPTASQAWLDWIEPALLRNKPLPPPVAPPVKARVAPPVLRPVATRPGTAPAMTPATRPATAPAVVPAPRVEPARPVTPVR